MGKLLSRSFLHKFMTLAVTLAVFAGTIFITTPAYADIWSRGSSYSGTGATSQRSSSSSSSSSKSSSSSSSSSSKSSSGSSKSSSSSKTSSGSSSSSSSGYLPATITSGRGYYMPTTTTSGNTTTTTYNYSNGQTKTVSTTTTSSGSTTTSKMTNSSGQTTHSSTTTKSSSGGSSTTSSSYTYYTPSGGSTSSSSTKTTTGNYTTQSSSSVSYSASGQKTGESKTSGSSVVLKDGSTYGESYHESKTYSASGKVVTSNEGMTLANETSAASGSKQGNSGSKYVLSINKNADGTSQQTSTRTMYSASDDISTIFSTIEQTRADGESITSEFIDNWRGDVLDIVQGDRKTENTLTADKLGELMYYNSLTGEERRAAEGEDGQLLPFGSSNEKFNGTKTTWMEIGPNGERIMHTVFTDENGEMLQYDMIYDKNGKLLDQNIGFQKDNTSEMEKVYESGTWITGESEARAYESTLGNFGIDYGKIELIAANSSSGDSTKRVDDPAAPVAPVTPSDDPSDPSPSGYSSKYSITANVKSHAGTVSISDTSKAPATYGNSQTWTYDGQTIKTISIVPDEGYRIKDVQINGLSQGVVSLISVASSENGTLVNVWFERISHKITATYGNNPQRGIVSPSGVVSVYDGESQTFNFVPDKNCSVAFVIVDGEQVNNPGNSYTFNNVKEDHTLHVEFSDANSTHFKFIYATSGEGGSLSLEGCIPVTPGLSQDIQIVPDEGFEVDKIIVDGQVREAATHFKFEAVNENHTIHVTFKEKAARTSFVVTATAGTGGSISPNGMTTVASGGSLTFKMTPDTGYMVGNVYVNGQSAGMMGELTLTNIFDDQTIYATFINTSVDGADLMITDITPEKVYAGMKAMSFVRVMNLGNVAAKGADVKLTVNGQTYTETINENIYPGSYYDVMIKWPASLTAGTVTAQAQVNTNGAVNEANKDNNSFSKSLTVIGIYPEAEDNEDPGVINPEAYSIPNDNPVADITWEQNGELYRALAGVQVTPSAEGLKSGYGFEATAIVQVVTNSPHLSVDDLKVMVRLPEFGYAKCKILEEDTSKRTDTTEDGIRTITCTYRFAVNTTSKVGARKWYVPVSWPDLYNYKMHTQVIGIATPAGYIDLSQNSSILINSNMYTDDSLGRG